MIKRLVGAAALAALFLAVTAGVKYVANTGAIEQETATRIIQVLIGLGLAAYANLMPKQVGPFARPPAVTAQIQGVMRFGGWALTLAGLVSAALWAFAPVDFANNGSVAVIASAVIALMARVAWSYRRLPRCQ